MVRLFTSFYNEPREVRRAEYFECLERNLSCETIDEVRILSEGQVELPKSGKLFVKEVSSRPTYDDFFAWVNELAGPDDISVIANSDIWFDGSLAVASKSLGDRDCYALARWDGDVLTDRNDSQDSWIFRGSVKRVTGNFPPGVPRCDNRLLYELQAAGYCVHNPAFAIVTHHNHAGKREEYGAGNVDHFVEPPYRYLWPQNLWSLPKTAIHNLRHPDERIGWRLDRRKAAAMLPFRILGKARRLASRSLAGAGGHK